MESADKLRVEAIAQLFAETLVARKRDERLPFCACERMRADGNSRRSDLGRLPYDFGSEPLQLGQYLVRVAADRRRGLDEAGEELGLQPFVRLRHDLLEHRSCLQRLGVDEEQLLLDAERERRGAAPAHSGRTACTGLPAASQA